MGIKNKVCATSLKIRVSTVSTVNLINMAGCGALCGLSLRSARANISSHGQGLIRRFFLKNVFTSLLFMSFCFFSDNVSFVWTVNPSERDGGVCNKVSTAKG